MLSSIKIGSNMVGLSGRIVAVGKGQVQIELMNSGQIIDLASSIPFSIGDPVLVSSDQGKPVGVIRAAKKFVVSSAVNERLGEYWTRTKK